MAATTSPSPSMKKPARAKKATGAEKVSMRFVEVRGVRYLRAEDVASYIRTLSATEETDVRHRLEAAAAAMEMP